MTGAEAHGVVEGKPYYAMASIEICKGCSGFYTQMGIDYGLPRSGGDEEYYCHPPSRGSIYGPMDGGKLSAFKPPKGCPFLAEQRIIEWNEKEKRRK